MALCGKLGLEEAVGLSLKSMNEFKSLNKCVFDATQPLRAI